MSLDTPKELAKTAKSWLIAANAMKVMYERLVSESIGESAGLMPTAKSMPIAAPAVSDADVRSELKKLMASLV